MTERWDNLIVGGGFFGLYMAEHLARRGESVLVCERAAEVMGRASYHNQARVHNGYHYPRSLLTAVRSHVNYPRFVAEFPGCIDESFAKYYAVGRRFSKVSANQFRRFMQRVGSPVSPPPASVRRMFDSAHVEDVFHVREVAFDAVRLKEALLERCRRAGVEVQTRAEVVGIRPRGDGLEVDVGGESLCAGRIFVCAYSQLNQVVTAAGLPPVPLKHELVELALVEVPEEVKNLGVTVMCGPFFSCMPFPPRGLHTLSHVRYTPHSEWHEGTGSRNGNEDTFAFRETAYDVFARSPKITAFPQMMRDAARYMPALRHCRYVDSLWEVKTVLPRSEIDDSRPILYKPHYGLRNLHVVMGAKIDNVYDAVEAVDATLESAAAAT